MSVYDANSYRRMSYSDTQGECRLTIPRPASARFLSELLKRTGSHLVIVSLHHVHVRRNSAQILVSLSIAYIAGAQYLLDLSRYKQFLELPGKVVDAMWDVQVADNENENHPDAEYGGCRNGDYESCSNEGRIWPTA